MWCQRNLELFQDCRSSLMACWVKEEEDTINGHKSANIGYGCDKLLIAIYLRGTYN